MDEFSTKEFINELQILCKDSGKKAKLRRGLSAGNSGKYGAMMILFQILPDNLPDHLLDLCRTVAAFYAINPYHSESDVNIGSAMAKLVNGNADSMQRRLERICTSKRDRAIEQVEHIMKMIAQNSIPINYVKLFDDLKYWSRIYKTNSAQSRWVKNFFFTLKGV
jgi:CRISPR type I-E-associated protein CasB/Cse2